MRFPRAVLSLALALFVAPAWARAAHPPPDPVETIELRPGELPGVNLTSTLLYRILVAELSARRGEYDVAAQGLLSLARDTLDPRLAERAFRVAMTGRNVPLALRSAREWARLAPDDAEAVAASLALAASSGQTAGLASTLRARIQAADEPEQAVLEAAAIVSRMADKRLALEVLDRALAPSVQTLPLARLALSDAAWAAGEPGRALEEARAALRLDPDSHPAARRILEYGLRVDEARAVSDTEAYLERHPTDRRLRLTLIGQLTRMARYDQALAMLDRMRQAAPEDFDLLYTAAEVNVRAARYAQAQALLREYISIQQQRRQAVRDASTNAQADVSDARLLLVQIAEDQGDYAAAIAELRRVDEPDLRFQVQTHEAVLYGKMGDLTRARATLDAIKPADRRERTVIPLTMATIYREAGRLPQAVALLKEADLQMPDTPQIKYDLGMLLHETGDLPGFEAMMRAVIALDPDNANAYNSLGYTLVEQNRDLDEARNLLERALDLEPENPYILDSVGWYLYRTHDGEGALEYLRRAYEMMPAADVAAHLGEVLWHLRRTKEARRIWREGLQLDAQNATLLETLKRLGVGTP